jgi:hypothetical protein
LLLKRKLKPNNIFNNIKHEKNPDSMYGPDIVFRYTSGASGAYFDYAWQWRPDLIWFDNLNVTGTPNYYVQKMFSTHRGHLLSVKGTPCRE